MLHRSSMPWFACTAGWSAALLFMVQPMAARMVLPAMGGGPNVWTTCMLFFQAGLVGGYCYAHWLAGLKKRVHATVHASILVAACVFLPMWRGEMAMPPGQPAAAQLLAWLLTTVGLPYLALAGTAPLLQVWFARRFGERSNPYVLYAASNVGSLAGLLAYPFVFEPWLSMEAQRLLWSCGFGAFVLLSLFCLTAAGTALPLAEASRGKGKRHRQLSSGTVGKWLFLAFVPSTLLLSVTSHLTADVASIPFLWVVPLALYLLTYIIAFSRSRAADRRFWVRWLPLVILVLATVLLMEATAPLALVGGLHLFGLFWIALVCHRALAQARPHVRHLTAFYVCIAVGGMLGGLFNSLIAPHFFSSLIEYPVALVLVGLVPAFLGHDAVGRIRARDVLLPVALALLAWVSAAFAQGASGGADARWLHVAIGIPLVVLYTFGTRPLRFALGMAGIFLVHSLYPGVHGDTEARRRSFFGAYRVTRQGEFRLFVHGTTEHGRQSVDPARRGEPLAYYARTGPIGEVLAALKADDPRRKKIAVLGLGAGALAAYAQPGESWTFYELDPAVIAVAQDRRFFTYLHDARQRGAGISMVVGDARARMQEPGERYGLIIVDVFGSDSIPIHLFTREALSVYRSRLTEDGLIAVHYSSRYFQLRPILGAAANSVQPPMAAMFREDLWISDEEKNAGKAISRWAVFASAAGDPVLAELHEDGWRSIVPEPTLAAWTDEHASIFKAFE